MSLRTIMIFPEFDNVEIIDEIRTKYDPLANLVKPHITLVFPFDSQMDNCALNEILRKRLENLKPFELMLQGFSKQKDKYGNYIFLNVVAGSEELTAIHQSLYKNEFMEFSTGHSYTPHLTVGKLPSESLMDAAYDEVKTNDAIFKTTVDKISVELIGPNGESIIIIEQSLNRMEKATC